MYFRLSEKEMNVIGEVMLLLADWHQIAKEIGIPRNEQMPMSRAFCL